MLAYIQLHMYIAIACVVFLFFPCIGVKTLTKSWHNFRASCMLYSITMLLVLPLHVSIYYIITNTKAAPPSQLRPQASPIMPHHPNNQLIDSDVNQANKGFLHS